MDKDTLISKAVELTGPPASARDIIVQWASLVVFVTLVDVDFIRLGLYAGDRIYCEVGNGKPGDLIIYPNPDHTATICVGRLRRLNRKTITVDGEFGVRRVPHPPIYARIVRIIRSGTEVDPRSAPRPIQDYCGYVC
jgi:hypothetical protein